MPKNITPLHCQNCVKLSPTGACEIWVRMQGESTITPVTIQVCKACGWRDCLPVMVVKKAVEVKQDDDDTISAT